MHSTSHDLLLAARSGGSIETRRHADTMCVVDSSFSGRKQPCVTPPWNSRCRRVAMAALD
jgi:hypothetical protein